LTDAVVLAGGTISRREAAFREAVGVDCKSLIQINGRTMVGHVVSALHSAQSISRVAVVGPPELQGHPDCADADLVLPEAEGRAENLFRALEAFSDSERVLMVTSDTPLVTGPMFDDVLSHLGPDTDLGYVIVRAEQALRRFGARPAPPPDESGRQMPNWVTVSLRDGTFTGTACLLMRPEAAQRARHFIQGIFDNREMCNAVRVLRPVFGLTFLVRAGLVVRFPALRGLLSVADAERHLGSGLGMVCHSYVSPHAEVAFDVDHVTDIPIAERELRARPT
jgi:molybdopterin-guanine dinucleotide biosynthesis protein A